MEDARETADPFEAELRSFRPAAPSPALAESVGQELAIPRKLAIPRRPLRRWHAFASAAAAVAACVLVGWGVWRMTRLDESPRPPQFTSITTVPTSAPPDPGDDRPSLASYRRALSRSPSELDELLDRHAALLLPGDRAGAPAAARLTASTGVDTLR